MIWPNSSVRKNRSILFFVQLGLIIAGCTSGSAPSATTYTVSVTKTPISATKEKYTIKYYADGNPNPDSGFECYCKYVTGVTQWAGSGSDGCSGASGIDKAIPISGLAVTAGACCKAKPHTSLTPQPNVPDGPSCW